ncbi:MAG: PstS family phosphate ABC transporter substrate-binding protein [Opitutales bacterium]
MATLAPAASYTVSGSDLVKKALEDRLPQLAADRDFDLTLTLDGSMPAGRALDEGLADVAIMAIPDSNDKPKAGMRRIPLAFQISVVVVLGANSLGDGAAGELSGLSTEQLSGIFGDSSERSIREWSDLGVRGSFDDKINPLVVRGEDDFLALELFKYTVMPNGSLRGTVPIHSTQEAAEAQLLRDSSAIGVLPGLPKQSLLRPVAISKGRTADGSNNPAFGPSAENVYHGDYVLRLPFYVVFPETRTSEVEPLVRLLLSEEVAEALTAEGFVSVPEKFRLDLLAVLDRPN